MLIEQATTYAYKLKYLENPLFDKVKTLAKKFIDELPKELVDDLFNAINSGVDILKTEPEMLVYLYSFGNMHQAKLNKAFENIPEILFDQPEINIIDYGCGQAIGTMCYVDFIRQKGVSQKVKRVTLIEPSEICLKRAALHVSKFCPDAEIVTVHKSFDDLDAADIVCEEDIPTLHILSNVLDLEFDLERFAELISDNLKGYNQFVCVGPYFGFSDKDRRMVALAEFMGSNISFSKAFGKGEFNAGRNWTCQAVVASVGELEDYLSTEVTEEDIKNGVEDEFGVVYSNDGKRLLKCNNNALEKYEIKKGTKVICDYSLCGLSLQQMNIPDTVVIIGDGVFESCFSLAHISIPSNIIHIGKQVFTLCNNLKGIKSYSSRFIVQNKMLIDTKNKRLIYYFGNADYLTIENTISSIDEFAFYGCESLINLIISDSVTNIGNWAFGGCSHLYKIVLPNYITNIGDNILNGCSSLQQICIPNSVVNIGSYALSGCSSLQQIYIPNSVVNIGNYAFQGCYALRQISIYDDVAYIGKNPFLGCNNLKINSTRFVVQDEMLIDIYENKLISYLGCSESVEIPKTITSIGNSAFKEHSLKHIAIPDSVSIIGDCAFKNCTSLQQIVIPDSVISIGKSAFWRCNSLKYVSISNAVSKIEKDVFEFCESLHFITIPNSVMSIESWAFSKCYSLQYINIPDSVMNIKSGAFSDCRSLQQVAIPSSVRNIDYDAFEGCCSLRQVILENNYIEKFKSIAPDYLYGLVYYLEKAIDGYDDIAIPDALPF